MQGKGSILSFPLSLFPVSQQDIGQENKLHNFTGEFNLPQKTGVEDFLPVTSQAPRRRDPGPAGVWPRRPAAAAPRRASK